MMNNLWGGLLILAVACPAVVFAMSYLFQGTTPDPVSIIGVTAGIMVGHVLGWRRRNKAGS